MNSNLFNRALGTIGPTSLQRDETFRLLNSLEAAPGIKFDSNETSAQSSISKHALHQEETTCAHRAGVNHLTIDRFEGRYLLSGGADSSILLWDLESTSNTHKQNTYTPLARSTKSQNPAHKFGITHLSFYPFDSQAFLSSSYDHTLKIYATETLTPSASFDLGSVVYQHALSPIADHLLVACATQHPAIRLVDLRSGASTHSLVGHNGAVLSVSWSPKDEHILASGGTDGTVQLWDIRRSAGSLGVLDLEDSVGAGGEDGLGKNARPRREGRAHVGACNGVVWTDDGKYLVTAGHDERVRVWDVGIGANALSHFGPGVRNTRFKALEPLIVPGGVGRGDVRVMLWPNEKEILMFDLLEGTLLKRLKVSGRAVAQAGMGGRNVRDFVTAIAWRAGDVEVYSAHSDGLIRAWKPRTREEVEVERDEAEQVVEGEDDGRKRKRQALDDVFRDLTRQKITFT